MLGPVAVAQAAGTHSAEPGVLQTAWFWQTAAEQVNPPVAPPAAPPTEPSGVPKGDVAVANTASDGSSSKQTALAFQVGALKAGATVDSFSLSLTLDSAGTNIDSSAAPVVACLPTRLWPAKEGADITDAPPTDCSTKVPAKVKGNTYTFAIAGIAQQWVGDVNVGVALINDPANTQLPFQTVFAVKSIKATMTYTPALSPSTPAVATSTALGGNGTGNGSGTGAGSEGSAATAQPPASVDLPAAGPTTATTPTTGQSPQIAPATPQTTPTALAKRAPSMPGNPFWLGAIAIALLVAVAAAVLADDAVPVPNATTSRLGRVLRDRERQRLTETTTPSRV